VFENPFAAPGRWYRANLHAHTTISDGDISPPDAVEFYRRAGYQILAITDHWHVADLTSEHDDFLLLPGAEVNGGRPAQGTLFDIVGLNLPWRGRLARTYTDPVQVAVDRIRDAGGIAYIAHPYWSGLMAPDILPVQGCFALEVYNSGCDTSIMRGYSSVHWDDVLTFGKDLGGLAVDDGHRRARDHGLGWTMIRAEELSVEAVMEALVKGRYYASTGPAIEDVRVEGDRIRVTTSPAASVALVSQPTWGGRVSAQGDGPLTEAEFRRPRCRYCRVEVTDPNGKIAWSNPILWPEYNESLGKTPWS
jgi:hypothetical protein